MNFKTSFCGFETKDPNHDHNQSGLFHGDGKLSQLHLLWATSPIMADFSNVIFHLSFPSLFLLLLFTFELIHQLDGL